MDLLPFYFLAAPLERARRAGGKVKDSTAARSRSLARASSGHRMAALARPQLIRAAARWLVFLLLAPLRAGQLGRGKGQSSSEKGPSKATNAAPQAAHSNASLGRRSSANSSARHLSLQLISLANRQSAPAKSPQEALSSWMGTKGMPPASGPLFWAHQEGHSMVAAGQWRRIAAAALPLAEQTSGQRGRQ